MEPETGPLASKGEWGAGRLAEPADDPGRGARRAARRRRLRARSLDGLRVLVTAGGTREPIDSVRYVGNRSSGRMGVALAAEAAARGAEVTLVAANVALAAPAGVRTVAVETAAELRGRRARPSSTSADVLLMAAAVADFRPAGPADGKIKKDGRDGLELELEPTDDVLAGAVAAAAPGSRRWWASPPSTARAASSTRADKLERKGLDAVVLNDISRADIGFDTERQRGHACHRRRRARRAARPKARRGGCHPR